MLWEILWRNKNTFSLGFTLSFSLLCILWQSNPFAQGMAYFGKMADRVSGALNSGLRLTGTLWVEIDEYRRVKEQLDAAQRRLEEYRLEKDKFDLLRLENEQLRQALDFPPPVDYPVMRAQVLGVRLNSISPRIIIGRGSADGVEPLMPVLARSHDTDQHLIRCVVGVVVAVDTNSSIVQPLTHPEFRMGVRVRDSGEWAILSGNSGRPTQALLTFLTSNFEPERAVLSPASGELERGNAIYSSGEGGIFPPGIPVGLVVEEGGRLEDFRTAYVRPFAPLSNLDAVMVVMKRPAGWREQWNRQARFDEHLETEFGPPQYPDGLRRPEPPRRNGPTRTTDTQPEQTPDNTERPEPGQTPADDRRRIINENLPGAQP